MKTATARTSTARLDDFVPRAKAAGLKVIFIYTFNADAAYIAANPGSNVWKCPDLSYTSPRLITTVNFVNFLYPGFKEYVVADIANLVQTYDLDGICLEDFRYSHMVYSFDDYHIQRAEAAGCDVTKMLSDYFAPSVYSTYVSNAHTAGFVNLYKPTEDGGDPNVVKWVDMRKGVLSEFVQAIKTGINAVRPGTQLSALFHNFDNNTPTDAYYRGSQVFYAQDYALHSNHLDVIHPYIFGTASVGTTTSWAVNLANPAGAKITANVDYYHASFSTGARIDGALNNGSYGVVVGKNSNMTTASWTDVQNRYLTLKSTTAIENKKEASGDFLTKNFPNPFNLQTEISFTVANPCVVSLVVYDALGRKVSSLINNRMDQGVHKVTFNANDLDEGIYFYRLNMGDSSATRKMILKK